MFFGKRQPLGDGSPLRLADRLGLFALVLGTSEYCPDHGRIGIQRHQDQVHIGFEGLLGRPFENAERLPG